MQTEYSCATGALEKALGLTPKDSTLYEHLQRQREAVMSPETPPCGSPAEGLPIYDL